MLDFIQRPGRGESLGWTGRTYLSGLLSEKINMSIRATRSYATS